MNKTIIQTWGRRKSAIARATLFPGKGTVRINKRALSTFNNHMVRLRIEEPFLLSGDTVKTLNVDVHVSGGGPSAQADASRLAIARALAQHDKRLHKVFLDYDRTLTVADTRRKETHKPNRHGKARAKRQKSYR
ncbi:30S ribosomal protein S9 [Candidatus Woesearchaeota archaeon]|nr:30S ribosomal protein S9 [Candidatus Woesearchaeota archaeon]